MPETKIALEQQLQGDRVCVTDVGGVLPVRRSRRP
ncbi:hypothetical protein FHT86_000668 [Rhizobium sp. BK313]|jgi:hypothetical protein|nr:hypothetical protein [Rhizobium sp. BK313]